MADEVLQQGVRGITDLMVMPGLINLDFADVRSVMQEMGKAMMGTGEASGDNRALEAAQKAIAKPLLDGVSMQGAKGVIISITGGDDMRLLEVDEAANHIRDLVDPDANIIWGSAFNPELEGRIRVSVVATGIDSDAKPGLAAPAAEPTKSFSFGMGRKTDDSTSFRPSATASAPVSAPEPAPAPAAAPSPSVSFTAPPAAQPRRSLRRSICSRRRRCSPRRLPPRTTSWCWAPKRWSRRRPRPMAKSLPRRLRPPPAAARGSRPAATRPRRRRPAAAREAGRHAVRTHVERRPRPGARRQRRRFEGAARPPALPAPPEQPVIGSGATARPIQPVTPTRSGVHRARATLELQPSPRRTVDPGPSPG